MAHKIDNNNNNNNLNENDLSTKQEPQQQRQLWIGFLRAHVRLWLWWINV